MGTSQLAVYNDALRYLGERRLASMSEDRTTRRELDEAWASVTRDCLESGNWRFAMRTLALDSDPDQETQFGYQYVFSKPDDWLRTYKISGSEFMDPPLADYNDEAGLWFCDVDPLYVRFVSGSAEYGMNVALWPQGFANYVATALAFRLSPTVKNSDGEAQFKLMRRAATIAKQREAWMDPPGFPPQGTWSASRRGSSSDVRSLWAKGRWRD